MDEEEQKLARALVENWWTTSAVLEEIRAEELRALTEQQRLFMLSDEHPARHRSGGLKDATFDNTDASDSSAGR